MIYLITYLLNLFDLLMTNRLISLYGIEIEANPIGRLLYENNLTGFVKIFVIGLLLILLRSLLSQNKHMEWIAYIPLVVYGLLALYHIGILLVLK